MAVSDLQQSLPNGLSKLVQALPDVKGVDNTRRKTLYNQKTVAHYAPAYDADVTYPPLERFTHVDPGLKATGRPIEGATLTKLTPAIGTVVSGRQLSSFTEPEKNELALLTAQRGVLVFRDQDFAEIGPQKQVDFATYFGPLQIHPTSAHIKNYPAFHLIARGYQDPQLDDIAKPDDVNPQESVKAVSDNTFFEETVSSVAWHSDISYELQPPGTTFLWTLQNPETGGDTVFASQVEAYKRLSPTFRERLEGLKVLHSGVAQADNARKRNGHVRRAPVENVHPLVRTHPLTKEKALYVNPGFSRRIIGLKKEESDTLLQFLYRIVSQGTDLQARVTWQPGTVVVWDNRVTTHTALLDFEKDEKRVIARLTPQAEQPIESL